MSSNTTNIPLFAWGCQGHDVVSRCKARAKWDGATSKGTSVHFVYVVLALLVLEHFNQTKNMTKVNDEENVYFSIRSNCLKIEFKVHESLNN